jgi:hypothetical protein
MKKHLIKSKRIRSTKIYDLKDILEYVEKHVKPNPNLDVVKWMAKNGR